MKFKSILVMENPLSRLGLSAFLTMALMMPMSVICQPQEPVNLLSTAKFVILAGSLVSNIPPSAVTGDIGLSPGAGSNVTGFGLTEVTGTVYTADASGPAGSVAAASELTTAKGDLTIAYNDAAGRTPVPTGPFLNPGSGNIGGLTLTPGLYKFTSGLSITDSDVTLSGTETDVWIFQIASYLTVGNGIQVILSGGARASNVFWQVGTSATLGTTSVFKGTIMADQSISLNTGASLEGRAFARIGAVTLASNAITKPTSIATTVYGIKPPRLEFNHSHTSGFSPITNIEFITPSNGKLTLIALNAFGKKVATIFSGSVEGGKSNQVQFNTNDLSKGLYILNLKFNDNIQVTKKLMLN